MELDIANSHFPRHLGNDGDAAGGFERGRDCHIDTAPVLFGRGYQRSGKGSARRSDGQQVIAPDLFVVDCSGRSLGRPVAG